MAVYMKTVLLFLLLAPITLRAQECASTLIDWNDYDKTLESIQAEYHIENFASVESALDCLMDSNMTFTSGKSGPAAAYWFFRKEMPGPGVNEQDEVRLIRWMIANKYSPYANFARLRLNYALAWNARGGDYASRTSEDQFKRFREQLLLTESMVLSDENQLKDTAISHNLLLAVTLDTSSAKTSPKQVFETGASRWPNYYDFYEVYLTRLVPKWGGSWEKVDEFINHWNAKLQEQENGSLYARLYYNVHSHNRVDPYITNAQWRKLKPSLIALYTKYPAEVHFEIAASYACHYADFSFYTRLKSEQGVRDSKAWLGNTSIARCDDHFRAIGDKPTPNE